MKRLLSAVVLALGVASAASAASSQPVAFDFQSVSLLSFMQATYKNLMQRDYVVSPDVLSLDKHISVSVKAVPFDTVPDFVDGLLSEQGVKVDRRKDGVYYLTLAAPAASASSPSDSTPTVRSSPVAESGGSERQSESALPVKLYRPDNRTVDFMVTVINAAFGSTVARPAGEFVAVSVKKDRLDAVLDFASQVDTLPRSVEVSASFVEVVTNSSSSTGLSLAASILGAKVGAVVGSGQGSVTVSTSGFQMVLDALVSDGRFKTVSNSRIVGDESEKVNLTVGDETPTLQSSGKDNAGNTVQSVVYRSSGVILDVLPKVLGSGRLSLAVDGQVSSFKTTTTGVVGSPTLSKRQVKTAVTVRDGDVLIIGGLEGSSHTDSRSGLAFLPASLSSKSGVDQRTDLLLVLSAKTITR